MLIIKVPFIRIMALFAFLFKEIVFIFLVILIFFPVSLKSQHEGSKPVIEEINDSLIRLNEITINKYSRSISIPSQINMSKGLIEVVLCKTAGKIHESLLVTKTGHVEIQTALLLLGFNPLNNIPGEQNLSEKENNEKTILPDSVIMFIRWEKDNKTFTERLEKFIQIHPDAKQMRPGTWLFRGLSIQENQVVTGEDISMIVTYFDPHAILELNSSDKFDDRLFYVNENFNLPVGTEVELIIKCYNDEMLK